MHQSRLPFTNRLVEHAILVNGTSASLLLDSGATATILVPDSVAGHAIRDRSVAAGVADGVGGQTRRLRKARGVRVRVGGETRTIDLLLGAASPSCGRDGLLGMDLLRSCAIVLGQRESVVFCRFGAFP
jgi:Aspartyl protease